MSALRKKKNARTDEEVSTNDKRVFIQINGPSSGCKGTCKSSYILYGSAYPFHFRNFTRIEMMKRIVTSEVTRKINDNAFCLQYF